MEFALDHNNKRIHASNASKLEEYFCPICHKKVILRKGATNIDHFAHQSICEDTWHYDMSEWHFEWQNQFPQKNQEFIVELNGEKHRADVMACGYVIEFQHSPITAKEFNERNRFYVSYGKKVIWIFDFIDEFESGRIDFYDGWSKNNDSGDKFKWSNPKRFLQDFLPQSNKNIIVFFQFSNSDYLDKNKSYIERVTWAIDEGGFSNFKRFCTSNRQPCNFHELLDWIKQQKL